MIPITQANVLALRRERTNLFAMVAAKYLAPPFRFHNPSKPPNAHR
jgi:hypothetical protein